MYSIGLDNGRFTDNAAFGGYGRNLTGTVGCGVGCFGCGGGFGRGYGNSYGGAYGGCGIGCCSCIGFNGFARKISFLS